MTTDEGESGAAALLGCRPGASPGEVRAAFRQAMRQGRPDLGATDARWLQRVLAARELLLAQAPPDRRRRPRTTRRSLPALRRATWGLAPAPGREVDLRL